MNTTASPVPEPPSALKAIACGGLAVGILDISSAFVAYGVRGVSPVRILQSVASGLLGAQAFQGGTVTAALGAGLHFFIATVATAVYYVASRKLRFLVERAAFFGLLYGEVVYLFMNFVVLPLSLARKAPFTWASLVTGPVGHLFFVGLPIALAVRKYGK